MIRARNVTLAPMPVTRAFVPDVRERTRRSVPMPRTQADREQPKSELTREPRVDISAPTSNGPRVSRVDRTRDRSTYAEWAAVYVGCTRELDGSWLRRVNRFSARVPKLENLHGVPTVRDCVVEMILDRGQEDPSKVRNTRMCYDLARARKGRECQEATLEF